MKTTSKSALSVFLALVMVVSMMSMGVLAAGTTFEPVSISEGEPVEINWSGTTTGTVTSVDGSGYIPASFVLWVEGTSTVTVGDTTVTSSMSNSGNDAYVIPTSTSGPTTIVATITSSAQGAEGTYTITCPAQNGTAPAGVVSAVTGYLPVGQFANGSGWGSASGKFTGGYSSTGVSLGAAGGYIQMDLSAPVYNLVTNPYGVDFIVYGNAFNGNPEAGAVKVYGYTSADDTTGEWYDLAGSLYYDSLSMNNAAVSYKKIEAGDDKGIWYRVNDNAWTKFNTNTSVAWWPETDEGYGSTWGNVDGVTWDQTNNTITYSGVSLVKDTDTTNDDNVFVNGVSVDASSGYLLTFTSGDVVQIITQSGTSSPYITVIKCN